MSDTVKTVRVRNKWIVLIVVSVGTFMVTLDGGMVGVSYPALVSGFRSDPSTVLWVIVAHSLTSTGLLLVLGWVADVIGRRNIFLLGFLVFTLGIGLCAISQTILQLIAFRVVQAIGTTMILANEYSLITAAFPSSERGKAVGFNVAAVGIGLSVGPVLGGFLLDNLDWRALFYTRLPVGVIGMLLCWLFLPKDSRVLGQVKVDYLGALALIGGLTGFLLMVNQGGKVGFDSPVVLATGGLALLLFPALILIERQASRPIIDLSLFKNRAYLLGVLVFTFNFLAQGSFRFVAPFYFVNALGYSAFKTGLFLMALPVMRLFVSPIAGILSDRLGYRLPVSLGMLLFALGLFMFSRQGLQASEWSIVLSLIIAGVGSALMDAPTISSIMSSVTHERLGTASASVGTTRNSSVSLGIALAGAIFTMREKGYLEHLSGQGLSQKAMKAQAIGWASNDTLLAGAILATIGISFALMMRSKGKTPPNSHSPS